jgi:CRP-like cAMP-binding protein
MCRLRYQEMMMHQSLSTLISWHDQPRRIVASGDTVISAGEPTDILYLLERGNARTGEGVGCVTGDLILLCEALALTHYATIVQAETDCEIILLPQDLLKQSLNTGGAMVWPLSRSIAADVTQRRLQG